MPVPISCPCGQTLSVPDTADRRVRCPACDAVHVAPVKPVVVEDVSSPAVGEPAARPRRAPRWHANREAAQRRAQRQVYLGCGSLAVLVGLGLVIAVHTAVVRDDSRVSIAGVCLAIFGLVSIVQALTDGTPNDGDE